MTDSQEHKSDHDLLRLMLAGDQSSFLALYRRLQGKIFRFALRVSGSEATAEDVTQEVFMALIHSAAQYDPLKGSVSAFLYGTARNLLLRHMEKERVLVPMPENTEDSEAALPECFLAEGDPLGDLTRSEEIEAVRQAVLSLPFRYREVVVLCDLEETNYAEAAAAAGCSVGTVRSRLHRGRAMLVEKLKATQRARAEAPAADPARCFA